MPLQVSQTFADDRYHVERPLGEGGMGSVFLALDRHLGRRVALKIPQLSEDPRRRRRFQREARTAALLRHPNICPIFDVGESDGRPFLAMAYIEGRPLSHYVSVSDPPAERAVLQVIRKLASALREAHKNGVVHRDIKPSNVLIDRRGEPILMDFGLAYSTDDEDGAISRAGFTAGTPAYMAPERLRGETPTACSDVFSLGVTMFELLTGRRPFGGVGMSVISEILDDSTPEPAAIRRGLHPATVAVCKRAIEKCAERRIPTMRRLGRELKDARRRLDAGALNAGETGRRSQPCPEAGEPTRILAASPTDADIKTGDLPIVDAVPSDPSGSELTIDAAAETSDLITLELLDTQPSSADVAIQSFATAKKSDPATRPRRGRSHGRRSRSRLLPGVLLAVAALGLAAAAMMLRPSASPAPPTVAATNDHASSREPGPPALAVSPQEAPPVAVVALVGDAAAAGPARIDRLADALRRYPIEVSGTLALSVRTRRLLLQPIALRRLGDRTPRDDVWIAAERFRDDAGGQPLAPVRRFGALAPGFGATNRHFGPELMLGHVLGESLDRPVVVVALSHDEANVSEHLRAGDVFEKGGPLYERLVAAVDEVCDDPGQIDPSLSGRRGEIVGVVLFHGWSDLRRSRTRPHGRAEFKRALAALIRGLRRDWGRSSLPVAIGEFSADRTLWGRGLAAAQRETIADLPYARIVPTRPYATDFAAADAAVYGRDPLTYLMFGSAFGLALQDMLGLDAADSPASR